MESRTNRLKAKNVALAGVKSLTLNDVQPTTWLDLSTNFYLQTHDIGKNRAQSCSKQINQLNPYVKFSVTEEDLAKVDLSWFDQFTVRLFCSIIELVVRYFNRYPFSCSAKSQRLLSFQKHSLHIF
jgi:molybdopterin/thiamine biosynthesis adenylyltransferase